MNPILRSHSSGLILSFVLGAAAGAAIALLTTPHSGRETRRRLKDLAGDLADRATRLPTAMRAAGREAAATAREAFARGLQEPAAAAIVTRDAHH